MSFSFSFLFSPSSSSPRICLFIVSIVAMTPGAIALTRIPLSASYNATVLVRAFIPTLDDVKGSTPDIE
jgi:hypothetical protein